MDTKELRTVPAVEDRTNDVKATFLRNGNPYKCVEKNKTYQDSSTVPLSKVEVQTTRPCAVIGPDRIITRPSYSTNSPTIKSHEYWNIENGHPDYPYRTGEYQDPRNISPRLTYQENMLRVMVPNQYSGVGKQIEDINHSADKNIQPMQINVKAQVPGENKLCDVPYNQNPNLNEHRTDKSNETSVSNVNSSTLRNVSHGWPSSINTRPPLSYSGSEMYPYPDFPSNPVPRALPLIRPHHRSRHDEPVPMYGDPYYRPTNIRYEPYSLPKERYPQPRYDYLNYPNSFNPTPNYPSPKYDLPKFPPQYGYSQIPYKVRDPQLDYYKQPFPPKSHNLSYQNHELHSNYAQLPGACLQNKYTYPGEANLNIPGVHKPTYDFNNKQFVSPKSYPENYYLNELQRQHMKGPIINRNYMHVPPPYPYYRRENLTYKHNEITASQIKNPDSVYNNHLHRMPLHFSPNMIPSDYGVSQEDCGYVSQSSTTSVNSSDSIYNMYRAYEGKYGYANRNHPFFKESNASIMSANKQKGDIDVRQFLQMWNEGEEEISESGGNKEVNSEQTLKDSMNAQDQLYVLGLVNVPREELGKYEHIQKVSKLPENIKGYTNLELLSQFEQAIGSSNLSQPEHRSFVHSKLAKESINPLTLPLDPLSPLDVESKISQSVIHKEVGCNFEIKPCSPQMFMAEITSASTLSDERSIEKVHNPHKPQSPLSSCDKESAKGTQINMTPQKVTLVGNHSNLSISTSCEMEKARCSPRHNLDTVKPKYTYQDLEGNAGICLASLPRIDSDIELSFPEVNQQFINANKPDNVTPNTIRNTQDVMKPHSNSLKDTKEEDGDPFGNKQYKNKSLHMVRTDSVIIKNPDNINDKLEINSKAIADSDCTEKNIDIVSSTPINLALTSKSKSNEFLVDKNKDKEYHLTKNNFSIDEAINLSLNPIDPLYEEEFDTPNECRKNEWETSSFHEHDDKSKIGVIDSGYDIDSTECNNNSKSQIKQNTPFLKRRTQNDDITKPEKTFKNQPVSRSDDSTSQTIEEINTPLQNPNNNEKISVQACKKIHEHFALNTTITDIKTDCLESVADNLKSLYAVQPRENTHISTDYKEDVEKKQHQSEENSGGLLTVASNSSDCSDYSLMEAGRNIDSNSKILETGNLVSVPKYESVKFDSCAEANELIKNPVHVENNETIETERSESPPIADKHSDKSQKLTKDISESYTGELSTKLCTDSGKVSEMSERINIPSSYRHNKTKEIIKSIQTCTLSKSHNKVIKKSIKSYNFFKKHFSSLYQNLLLDGNTIITKVNACNISENVDDNINKPCIDLDQLKEEPPCTKYISTDENPVIKFNLKSVVTSNILDILNHSNANTHKESSDFVVVKEQNTGDKNISSIDVLSKELIGSKSHNDSKNTSNTEHESNETQNNNINQLRRNDSMTSNSGIDSSKIAHQCEFENDITISSSQTTNVTNCKDSNLTIETSESNKYEASTDRFKNYENYDDRSMYTNDRVILKMTDADPTASRLNESNLSPSNHSETNENNENIEEENENIVKIFIKDATSTEENPYLSRTSTFKPIVEKIRNNKDVNNTSEVIAAGIFDEIETSYTSTHYESISKFDKPKILTSEQNLEKIENKELVNKSNEIIEPTISSDSVQFQIMKIEPITKPTNENKTVQINNILTQTSISEPTLDQTRSKQNISDTNEVIDATLLNEIDISNKSLRCTNFENESMTESIFENSPVETNSSLDKTSPEQKFNASRDEEEAKVAVLHETQASNDSFNYESIEQELTTKSDAGKSPANICDHEHVDRESESYVCDYDKGSYIKAASSKDYYDILKTTDYQAKQNSKESVSSTCIPRETHDENKCESSSSQQTEIIINSLNILKEGKQKPDYLIEKIKAKAPLPVIVNYSDSDDDSYSDTPESHENLQQNSPLPVRNCYSNISSQFLNDEQNVISNESCFDDPETVETTDTINIFLSNISEGSYGIHDSETMEKYYDVGSSPNFDIKATGRDKSHDESFLEDQKTVDGNEHFKLENSPGGAILSDTDSPGEGIDESDKEKNSSILVKSNACENRYNLIATTCENNPECQDKKEIIVNNCTSTPSDNDVNSDSECETQEKSGTDLTEESDTIYIPLSNNVELAVMDESSSSDIHKKGLRDSIVRKTLKRSLSDSVIYNTEVLHDFYNKCMSPLLLHKRKKRFHEEDTENHPSLEFSTRRTSLSPSAQAEQVSFCILIDNDYIVSQESQDTSKAINCLTELHEDTIVTNNLICCDSVVDRESPSPDLDYNYLNVSLDTNDQTTLADWVDDVACVETVITDDNLENDGDIADWRNEDENSNSGYILQEGCNEDISNDYIYHTEYSPVNNIELNYESHHPSEIDDVVPSSIFDSERINFKDHTAFDDDDECTEVSSQRTASRSQSFNSVDKNGFCDIGADTVHDDMNEVSSSSKSFSLSSPPEVSSTTPEDKRSNILLKITNLNGSRTSQTTFESPDRKIRCKLTEKNDYLSTRSSHNQTKPLLTKAAQKYIPPLQVPDLKISLRLERHMLEKLRILKLRPPTSQYKRTNVDASTQRAQIPIKKPKPNFEDVLMNIDKAHVELQKDKLKKLKKNVPKVIIKKTQNGSHYTSPAEKHYNPDLTGSKWQPWVVIERSKFIDKMSIKGKTKAVYCHRKRTYILFEKRYKYKAAATTSANFVVSQFKSDHNKYKNQLKYTFRLKSGI